MSSSTTVTVKSKPKADKGPAAIVFFYMGDSIFTLLGQETTKLKKAMEGYEKVILLKHNNLPDNFDFSEADEKLADKIVIPTKANFFKYIVLLAKEGYYMDIWIWSHGYRSGNFICSEGTYKTKDYIHDSDIEKELSVASTGLTCIPIRMVYQINCWGKVLNDSWIRVGAKVSIGTRYINFYPTQFGKFADEWNKNNVKIKDAVNKSNTAVSRTVVQTWILADAAATHKQWGKCYFTTVLSDNDCAKKYFTKRWCLSNTEWQSGESGKENMNHSSEWSIAGDNSIKKSTKPSWE